MSADYRMENPYSVEKINLLCYRCSKSIDIDNPTKGHESCIASYDGILKFDLDWTHKKDHE